ncbi:MAG: hypothetical protein QMB94_12755 [Phycisphaerales bacterium]
MTVLIAGAGGFIGSRLVGRSAGPDTGAPHADNGEMLGEFFTEHRSRRFGRRCGREYDLGTLIAATDADVTTRIGRPTD